MLSGAATGMIGRIGSMSKKRGAYVAGPLILMAGLLSHDGAWGLVPLAILLILGLSVLLVELGSSARDA